MPLPVNVAIHASQFPENVRRDLLESLRRRRIHPKFHYDSHKQAQKWLALHEAYSPSRMDADCLGIYEKSFIAAGQTDMARLHVIGLGCGGGQKEARLLQILTGQGKKLDYTPCDVSVALVLTAQQAAFRVVPEVSSHSLVCDLAVADDLPGIFGDMPRILTFFGMIPNFEPALILPRLAALVRGGDRLLFSANLAPGPDYAAGMERILPGYDNALTRDWLATFLYDLGVEPQDGAVRVFIEDSSDGLKRVAADYHFERGRTVSLEGERFIFEAGDKIRLFFSYRYTPDRIAALLKAHSIEVLDQFVTPSGEEAVFVCGKGG